MEDEIQHIVSQLSSRCEKIGLYPASVAIVSKDTVDPVLLAKLESDENGLKNALSNGEVQLAVYVSFRLGDVAFSDRVQFPERFETDKQFQAMVPTPQEEIADRIRAKMEDDDPLAWLDDD